MKVTIERARELQQEGEWVDNPKYDPTNKLDPISQMPKVFKAKYAIYWRPENDEYAVATEV